MLVPADTAVNTPVMVLIVAADGLLEDQVPPALEAAKFSVEPTQAAVPPVIGVNVGNAFTATNACTLEVQPFVVTV